MTGVDQRLGDLLGRLESPAAIVTAMHDGERAGCLVGNHVQCSIDPMRVLVCLSPANATYRVATSAPLLSVHYLQPSNRSLAELFGGTTGDEIDKFAACSWSIHGRHAGLILDDVAHWWIGLSIHQVVLGDHVGFVLEPFEVHDSGPYSQLSTTDLRAVEPGHPRDPG